MNKKLQLLVGVIIVFTIISAVYAQTDLVLYAKQYKPVVLSQITSASDTTDVVQVKANNWNKIMFHLVVSNIDDSLYVKFQGSVDNSESTYTNLDTTGNPTRITTNGCHTFSFTNASNLYYYRIIKVSEAGGTNSVITPIVTLGREW